jgi:DNA polymerase-3 subunit delta
LKLKATQCKLILDAVGPNCGLLHQELAKLALYATNGAITDDSIRSNVGSWSTRTMWEIADSIMDGKIADALDQLERVYSSGQHPAAVIPQIAWSLRRYGNAAQLILQSRRQGKPMTAEDAVKQCGFWGGDLSLAPQRLRRIGLQRASKLLEWLLELDLRIKGTHSSTDRAIFALEELCLRFV